MSRQSKFLIDHACINDLDEIVALHMSSFSRRDHIGLLFGISFVRTMYRWFLSSDNCYVLAARLNGRLAGYISVSDTPYDRPVMRHCLGAAALGLLRRPWIVFNQALLQRLLSSFRGSRQDFGRNVENYAQVGFTAVSNECRGLGVATRLRGAAVDESKRRGSRYLFTGMRESNIASRKPYEKLGFSELPELRSRGYVYFGKEL